MMTTGDFALAGPSKGAASPTRSTGPCYTADGTFPNGICQCGKSVNADSSGCTWHEARAEGANAMAAASAGGPVDFRPAADEADVRQPPKADEAVNHPSHYNHRANGIECIDFIEGMSFNCGNAVKYVDRAPYKGKQVEDLEKARWYIEREIARLNAEKW